VKCIDEEIPFEIPESWEWCRLGSVVSLISGQDFPPDKYNSNEDGIPYIIGASNIFDGKLQINRWTTTPSVFAGKGDLLLVCKGAGVGKMCLCDLPKAHIARQIQSIRVYNNHISIEYIKQVLDCRIEDITSKANGLIPGLNRELILNFFIPIPPVDEQKKINQNIISSFELINSINRNKLDLSKIINQAKSKILDLAIRGKLVPQDPNDEPASVLLERIKSEHPESKKKAKNTGDNSHYQNLPQGWTECTLENIGSWSSGATPNRSNIIYYEKGTVNWLKTGDLNDGYIDYIPEKITELALKECSVRLNPKDSVLIAMYGATIGKIGILNIPATTNQACCACITYSGIYNKFLFYLLMGKKRILQMKAEGGAQPNISKEKITNFSIFLPPSQEQIRIVQTIENLFQRLDNITEEL
jgi:type I restriction enzyme S subunit